MVMEAIMGVVGRESLLSLILLFELNHSAENEFPYDVYYRTYLDENHPFLFNTQPNIVASFSCTCCRTEADTKVVIIGKLECNLVRY